MARPPTNLFDFPAYLAEYLDPSAAPSTSSHYSIQYLTGGIVNVVVRAKAKQNVERSRDFSGEFALSETDQNSANPNERDNGRFSRIRSKISRYDSFILKFAPPYIAATGPSAPFDVFRQTIEARALSLFVPIASSSSLSSSGSPSGSALGLAPGVSLAGLCEEADVLVPELLFHDDQRNVLVISDLGEDLVNLSDHFLGLLLRDQERKDFASENAGPVVDRSQMHYWSIGHRIGRFFALLHSPRTLSNLRSSSTYSAKFLDDPSNRALVFSEAIAPLREHLQKFPHLVPINEAHDLYERIEDCFYRKIELDEESLVIGDCWTSSILIEESLKNNLQQDYSDEPDTKMTYENFVSHPKVGIIDWEFASIGKGFDGDVSQLLAHFEQFATLGRFRGNRRLENAATALMDGVIISYQQTSVSEGATWTGEAGLHQGTEMAEDNVVKSVQHRRTDSGFAFTEHDSSSISRKQATLLRSFIISHAAEMVNCAFWKDWDCGPSCCRRQELQGSAKSSISGDVGHPELERPRKEDCRLVQQFMSKAVECLRRAGKDIDEFLDGKNLDLIVNNPIGLSDHLYLNILADT